MKNFLNLQDEEGEAYLPPIQNRAEGGVNQSDSMGQNLRRSSGGVNVSGKN
jgi:hypothetical protein